MDIQLFRIDDRLIHGQVVLGWATALNSDSIILCDDSVSKNDWEKELYLSCVPEYLKTRILSVDETHEVLNDNQNLSNTIILANGPEIVEKLVDKGLTLNKVNIGGIHFRDGRKSFLPYLYLDEEEVKTFLRCMEKGVVFECQDVPTGSKVNLKNLLT